MHRQMILSSCTWVQVRSDVGNIDIKWVGCIWARHYLLSKYIEYALQDDGLLLLFRVHPAVLESVLGQVRRLHMLMLDEIRVVRARSN
jgi:hypothetical protein